MASGQYMVYSAFILCLAISLCCFMQYDSSEKATGPAGMSAGRAAAERQSSWQQPGERAAALLQKNRILEKTNSASLETSQYSTVDDDAHEDDAHNTTSLPLEEEPEPEWEDDTAETRHMLELEAEESDDSMLPNRSIELGLLATQGGDVVCGGHTAATCAECPRGHGAGWCNGVCKWENGGCVSGFPSASASNPFGCPTGEGKCQKRTLSIHLSYMRPSAARSPSWYYNEIRVQDASTATYLATNTHGYGYAGIQMAYKNPQGSAHPEFGDRVICSTWDQSTGNAKMTECGAGVECVGFGGEGTGAKALWYFKWAVGKRYAFVLSRAAIAEGRVEHKCWFYAEELEDTYPGGWKHIATATSGTNGYGTTFKDSGSFLEQWTHDDTRDERKAEYGPTYYRNSGGLWAQSTTSKFMPYCHKERERQGVVSCDHKSVGQSANGERIWMQTGGVSGKNIEEKQLSIQKKQTQQPWPLRAFEATIVNNGPAPPHSAPTPSQTLAPTPSPTPGVLHRGEDCWGSCSGSGSCNWCGQGNACCRKNWGGDPAICKGVTDFSTYHHECVKPV